MAMVAALFVLVLTVAAPGQEPKAGQPVSLEVVFADVGPAAGEGEITAASILELEKQGKLDSATRIRLSLIENVSGSVQFGEMVPIITAAAQQEGFPGGRGGGAAFSRQNLGTMVQATARVEADGTVVVELTAEHSRLVTPKQADDPAVSEPQKIVQTTLRTTVRVASGKPVIVGGQQSIAGKESASTYVVLTATAPDVAKAAAAPAEVPAAIIKVFTLSNARASDVLKAIRPIVDERLIFAADERTNSIIAQGGPGAVGSLGELDSTAGRSEVAGTLRCAASHRQPRTTRAACSSQSLCRPRT